MSIRTALVSVSDKSGLASFARALADHGVHILSSGGTAKSLSAEGIAVETVETYTGSPEVMDGRVKTLHPRVHGGILSRGERDRHDLDRLGGREIDLVVVNLYPFERVAADLASTRDHIVENIDIGGPSMVRSAAKNHARVTVVCDPQDYGLVLDEIARLGDTTPATRAKLAAKAFAHTAAYDGAISGYLSSLEPDGSRSIFPRYLTLPFERAYGLRYGENPHQAGAFYVERGAAQGSLACAQSIGAGGKELSFNNLVDADAALDAVREFEHPAAVVVKHTNPCGVAVGQTLADAYRNAREADPLSAFGGIVALNREVDEATARVLAETFLECVVAGRPARQEESPTPRHRRMAARRARRARVQAGRRRPGRTEPRRHGGRRGDPRQDRDQAPSERRRSAQPGVCLARLQTREIERDRTRAGRGHGRCRRRPDVARRFRADRVRESRRQGARERARVRRVLSLPRRGRGSGTRRRHRHRTAGRERERSRRDRGGRRRRSGNGSHRSSSLPALRGSTARNGRRFVGRFSLGVATAMGDGRDNREL